MKLAFYKGREDLYDRLISWWTRGPYSHVELVIGEGLCYSSSPRDGGVRAKFIDLLPERWDVVDLGDRYDDGHAIDWFEDRIGARYDTLGILGFVWGPTREDRSRYFCSEAVAAALKIKDPWRFDPNALHALVTSGL